MNSLQDKAANRYHKRMTLQDPPEPPAETAPDAEFAATDQCVLCGLCLPHCPTYGITHNEAESPRGRVSLIQALAKGELAPDGALQHHLGNCLVCRACEDACPAEVPYGRLIDAARAELHRRGVRDPWRERAMNAYAERRDLRRLIYAGLHILQRPEVKKRLQPWLPMAWRRPFDLGRHEPRLPLVFDQSAREETSGKAVYLFTGCAGEVFDRETLISARRILEALGYRVITPSRQTCCGALHLHAGERSQAKKLASANLAAFDQNIPILATSSACAVTLSEYDQLLGDQAASFGHRAQEISTFLAAAKWAESLSFSALSRRAVMHTPCTQLRVLHSPEAPAKLLSRIPDLTLIDLPGNDRCCGAAGSYMLDHPQMAKSLRTPKLDAIASLNPDFLVTTNIGCTLHLAQGLGERGMNTEVLHPLTLLARQLDQTSSAF